MTFSVSSFIICLNLCVIVHLFNGLFFRDNLSKPAQKGKPFWILMKQEMTGWQCHQLDYLHLAANR